MSSSPDPVRDIARAVLYEGYMLWPYRRSAVKNQRRWTFGSVFPAEWNRGHPDDPCSMRAECLVERPPDGLATVTVSLRFLHVVRRQVAIVDSAEVRFVDALEIGGERHVPWDEAMEKEVALQDLRVDRVDEVATRVVVFAATEREWLEDGERRGTLVRSREELDGRMRARSEPLDEHTTRVSVVIQNESPWSGEDRESALRSGVCFDPT